MGGPVRMAPARNHDRSRRYRTCAAGLKTKVAGLGVVVSGMFFAAARVRRWEERRFPRPRAKIRQLGLKGDARSLLLALLLLAPTSPVSGQDPLKIEIVPDVAHTSDVTSVAFSSNGAQVLSGSGDHTLRLWDGATGRLTRIFRGHTNGVT